MGWDVKAALDTVDGGYEGHARILWSYSGGTIYRNKIAL